MGDTSIEWTDKTWNPVRGCSRVSEGCRNCYAEGIAVRFDGPGYAYEGLTSKGRWNGTMRFVPEKLSEPLKWRKPARVFVNSMSDLFHDGVTNEQIAAVFGVMAAAPEHTFQVLTKRPERMRAWFKWVEEEAFPSMFPGRNTRNEIFDANAVLQHVPGPHQEGRCPTCPRGHCLVVSSHDEAPPWPLPNVWLGVSVENQKTADERIPVLLDTPAAIRWISYEPALGPVSLQYEWTHYDDGAPCCNGGTADVPCGCHGAHQFLPHEQGTGGVDWVVAGGESGRNARLMRSEWATAIRDECFAAGIPFLFKQWGAYDAEGRRVGKKRAGRILEGEIHNDFPEAA